MSRDEDSHGRSGTESVKPDVHLHPFPIWFPRDLIAWSAVNAAPKTHTCKKPAFFVQLQPALLTKVYVSRHVGGKRALYERIRPSSKRFTCQGYSTCLGLALWCQGPVNRAYAYPVFSIRMAFLGNPGGFAGLAPPTNPYTTGPASACRVAAHYWCAWTSVVARDVILTARSSQRRERTRPCSHSTWPQKKTLGNRMRMWLHRPVERTPRKRGGGDGRAKLRPSPPPRFLGRIRPGVSNAIALNNPSRHKPLQYNV